MAGLTWLAINNNTRGIIKGNGTLAYLRIELTVAYGNGVTIDRTNCTVNFSLTRTHI